MRADPYAGAAASRGGSGASPHRRCGSTRTRERIQAPALPGFSHSMPGFRKNATRCPPPPGRGPRIGKSLHGFGKIATRFGSMAGFDVAICGISGIRRRKAGDGPPNTKGVGCRVLGCSVAVLQGAGLQCCRVLGCEVAGLQGRWVQSCWVRGCGLRSSVLQGAALQPKTKAGQKRFRC